MLINRISEFVRQTGGYPLRAKRQTSRSFLLDPLTGHYDRSYCESLSAALYQFGKSSEEANYLQKHTRL